MPVFTTGTPIALLSVEVLSFIVLHIIVIHVSVTKVSLSYLFVFLNFFYKICIRLKVLFCVVDLNLCLFVIRNGIMY